MAVFQTPSVYRAAVKVSNFISPMDATEALHGRCRVREYYHEKSATTEIQW